MDEVSAQATKNQFERRQTRGVEIEKETRRTKRTREVEETNHEEKKQGLIHLTGKTQRLLGRHLR